MKENKICPCCKINKLQPQKNGKRLSGYCEKCNRVMCNVRVKMKYKDLDKKIKTLRKEAFICGLVKEGFTPLEIAKMTVVEEALNDE